MTDEAKRDDDNFNMEIWQQVCVTPQKYMTDIPAGKGLTSISATYQLRRATEIFGPYGYGWGIDDLKVDIVDGLPVTRKGEVVTTKTAIMSGTFWYIWDGGHKYSFQVIADRPFKPGEFVMKSLLTELQSKGLSKLGFSADVYAKSREDHDFAQFARVADAAEARKERQMQITFRGQAIRDMIPVSTADELDKILLRLDQWLEDGEIEHEDYSNLMLAITERLEIISRSKDSDESHAS